MKQESIMRRIRFVLPCAAIAAALCLTLIGCGPAPDPQGSLAQAWPDNCQGLKAHLADTPAVNVRFSPLPETIEHPPVWTLRWQGHAVPVPMVAYSKFAISLPGAGVPHGGDSVMLLDDTGHGVFLAHHSGFAPMADAFGMVPLGGGELESEQEGVLLTELLWGGPVGLGEMIVRGFEVSLDDIDCRGEHWAAEMAASVGLILKSAGSGGLSHAYRLSEQPLGWLVREQSEQRQRWMATWLRTDTPDLATGIEVWLPAQAADAELGLLLAAGPIDAAPAPEWLQALQRALDSDARADWETLAAALPAAGFDARSSERLAKFIGERFSENNN